MRNDNRAHTTLYSGEVKEACGLFGNSIDTSNIAANISGSNCDHIYSVEDKTNSYCDTNEKVDDKTGSNCDTCLVEDDSIRLGGKNSIHL